MLEPGSHVGPYEVLGPLGAGGMGEVVRARDTRLGREVAIKTLPDAFAADPERLARFEREARLLATLHQPNIAGIFGVEEAGGHRHLILELVEGPTLAERIDRGPLPIEEALDLARQIATALEFAHEHGVIHRDLKPGNVKITPAGEVKVLDFGLAKGQVGSPSSSDLSNSPTMSASPTGAGVILGTAAYMSPEQARGRPVDRRTDIWSFGCVLFEMLTGRQLFQGETVTDVLAKILQSEPDWSALPAATPPRIRALLARCLRKDPKERLRDIGDARIEIAEVLAGGPAVALPAPVARRGSRWPVLVGALALGATLAGVAFLALTPRPSRVLRRLAIEVPNPGGTELFDSPALSHDGRAIVYVSDDRLWYRDLSRFESAVLAGTEGAGSASWSLDDRRVCFEQQGRLKVMPVPGGIASDVCALPDPGTTTGTSWARDGSILFTLYRGGLYQVPSSGGTPRLVCAPRADEEDLHLPQPLPDGRRVVLVGHRRQGPFALSVVSLVDGRRTDLRLIDRMLCAVYSPEGYLLLFRERPSAIEAVRFDAGSLRLTGDPVRIAPGGLVPSVSDDGTLAYVIDDFVGMRQMVWVDARGHVIGRLGPPRSGLLAPELSHDQTKVAYGATDGDAQQLFVYDIARGLTTRVVADSTDKQFPHWSSDDATLFYQASLTDPVMWSAPVDGSAPPRRYGPGHWASPTPDGHWLVFVHEDHGHESLWRRPVSGGDAEPLWRSSATSESQPAISPDGRWLMYVSDESGAPELYVRAYPSGAGKQRVSEHGADVGGWARDGRALLFAARDTVFRVEVRPGAVLELSKPRSLFALDDIGNSAYINDIARDGRLLGTVRSADDPRRGILLVEHWSEELRRH